MLFTAYGDTFLLLKRYLFFSVYTTYDDSLSTSRKVLAAFEKIGLGENAGCIFLPSAPHSDRAGVSNKLVLTTNFGVSRSFPQILQCTFAQDESSVI